MSENMQPESTEQQQESSLEKAEKIIKEVLGKGKSKIGITRRDKSPAKKAVKLAKKQRKVNQQRKNQKRRPTGSKQRK
jgi:hypothetical protein